MCLIVVAWQSHPRYQLVAAANRDEFFARPSAAAGRWPKQRQIIAGRDLQAGGSWLGVTDQGRFAAVTNVREAGEKTGARSRGALVQEFLAGTASASDFAHQIDGAAYAGFNLLLADGSELFYASNRIAAPQRLAPGIHALSNHRLGTPWPKLCRAQQRFHDALPTAPASEQFFDLLADRAIARDEELPDTGISLDLERQLSAIFVSLPGYGTRASTFVCLNPGDGFLHERRFNEAATSDESRVEIA